jgi:hypothetical protein
VKDIGLSLMPAANGTLFETNSRYQISHGKSRQENSRKTDHNEGWNLRWTQKGKKKEKEEKQEKKTLERAFRIIEL